MKWLYLSFIFLPAFTFGSNIKWKSERINLGKQYPDTYFEFDLSSAIDNPNGETVKFSFLGAPKWMLIRDNILCGKPSYSDVGPYYGILLIAESNSGAFETTEGYGEVIKTIRPPKWKSEKNLLEEAMEDIVYSTYLNEYIDNPDSLPISFYFLDKNFPKWLNLTPSGTLFGIPKRTDVGNYSFKVACEYNLNESKVSVEGTLVINVKWANKLPVWKNKSIFLGQTNQGQYFEKNLKTFVDDPDLDLGDILTFEKINGANWLEVDKKGKLYGTPNASDVGENQFIIRVSDLSKSSDDCLVTIKVLKVNSLPVIYSDIKFDLKEREEFNEDLNQKKYVFDADGDSLKFSLITKEEWISLKEDGKLELRPKHSNIGTRIIEFLVKDFEVEVRGSFIVSVKRDPRPPVWLENPVVFSAIQNENFETSISLKAKELDGVPLRFTKVSGPNWLTVKGDGTLFGLPTTIGKDTFVIVAENDLIGTEGTLIIEIKQANRPPRWKQDPIILGSIEKDSKLDFELSQLAVDDDGDNIIFKIIKAPTWFNIDGSKLTGIPTELGDFSAVISACDLLYCSQAGVVGKVVLPNRPPIVHKEKLSFSVKERDALSVLLSNPMYVEDPDKDTLKFSLEGSFDWINLSENGLIIFRPPHSKLGNHPIGFKVNDGNHIVSATMSLEVLPDPRPPIWLEDPIHFTATRGNKFEENIALKVKELDMNEVVFSLKSGPSWLSVSSNGLISGIPKSENEGKNEFVISASSSGGISYATLIIDVKKELKIIKLDDKKAPLVSELLWIIDSSPKTNSFLKSLEEAVDSLNKYFKTINHSSLILSSRDFSGVPAKSYLGDLFVIRGDNFSYLFKERINMIWTNEKLNSPTWSLTQFIENSNIHEYLVKENFLLSFVPMEIIIFTGDKDSFNIISKGTDYENKDFKYYKDEFVAFWSGKNKPVTISSIDLRCPPVTLSNPYEEIYAFLSLSTFGTYYYQTSSCDDRIVSAILSIGESIALRSSIYSNKEVTLDKIPGDLNRIKVTLHSSDSYELEGNRGYSTDMWRYSGETNSIRLFWHNIRYLVVKGSELIIEY